MLKLIGKKIIQFYAKKMFLFKPVIKEKMMMNIKKIMAGDKNI